MTSLPIDDEHAAVYTVGQVASFLGVQPAFLRRLDSESVVSPERSVGGQRRYSRHQIGLVQRTTELMGEGMSVASVARLIELEATVAALRAELADANARLAAAEKE